MTTPCAGAAAEVQPALQPTKFRDPDVTACGNRRATVAFRRYETLWFNTGTLCNLTCRNCYIESSPTNDALVYLTGEEVAGYLDELGEIQDGPNQDDEIEIGFTGGEPFMNPAIMEMLEDTLVRGHSALVLTNAMRPMRRHEARLLELQRRFGDKLALRVSLDHYTLGLHEVERGNNTFEKAVDGLRWLSDNGFNISVAGRTCWGESEDHGRAGYRALFQDLGIRIDTGDGHQLMLFPEMDETADVPEITTNCWRILDVDPGHVMCAGSRMIVKRRGAERPAVVACTLLPYAKEFELGTTLAGAREPIKLNHPHCARFCVLGGASCSA